MASRCHRTEHFKSCNYVRCVAKTFDWSTSAQRPEKMVLGPVKALVNISSKLRVKHFPWAC